MALTYFAVASTKGSNSIAPPTLLDRFVEMKKRCDVKRREVRRQQSRLGKLPSRSTHRLPSQRSTWVHIRDGERGREAEWEVHPNDGGQHEFCRETVTTPSTRTHNHIDCKGSGTSVDTSIPHSFSYFLERIVFFRNSLFTLSPSFHPSLNLSATLLD